MDENTKKIRALTRKKLRELEKWMLKEMEPIPAIVVKYYYVKHQNLSGAQFLIDAASYISRRNPAMNEGRTWFQLMADWAKLVEFEKHTRL